MTSSSSCSCFRLCSKSSCSESIIWFQRGVLNGSQTMIPTLLGVENLTNPCNVEGTTLSFLSHARQRMMLCGEGTQSITNSTSIVLLMSPLYSSTVKGRVMVPRGQSMCPSKLGVYSVRFFSFLLNEFFFILNLTITKLNNIRF